MGNRTPDPVDALIDAAIKKYSDAEPLTGLEERILNRVAFERSGPRFKYGPLMAIAAALALSCLFVAPHLTEPRASASGRLHPPTSHRLFQPVSPEAGLAPKSPLPVAPAVKVIHRRTVRPLPKRDVFPTPQPPTAQELALMRFVERDPKAAAQAFAGLQKIDAPLDIAPLEIKPLETDNANN